jgi:rod shape-determining protein MreD
LVIRLVVSGKFPGWLYFAESFVAAALWPIATWILLAPQRRAIDRDETRPI